MKLMTRRTAIATMLGSAAMLTVAGCGSSNSDNAASTGSAGSEGGSYKIGVLQLTQHSALDAANKGFVDAVNASGLDVSIDQQNANNEQPTCQTIATKFVGDEVDLIFAIGTPAAQAAAQATTEIPIVGTAITDFAATGLVQNNDEPGTNVTGSSDLTPVAEQIDMLHKVLPDAKKVALLYASNESNSEIQIEMAEKALDEIGVGHERKTASNTAEVQSAVESIVGAGDFDAIYAPTDNTIAQAAPQVGQIALENKIPFITGEEGMCKNGNGLFTLSINYEDLGGMAGEMAVKILKGEAKPEDMAIEHLDSSKLVTIKNDDVAAQLGIDLSVLQA